MCYVVLNGKVDTKYLAFIKRKIDAKIFFCAVREKNQIVDGRRKSVQVHTSAVWHYKNVSEL